MKAFSGFVSNPSDRMIRNSAHNARNCGHVAESVCNSERGESQVNKLNRSSGGPDEGRLNNRKLHEPSHSALALRHTQSNYIHFTSHNSKPASSVHSFNNIPMEQGQISSVVKVMKRVFTRKIAYRNAAR